MTNVLDLSSADTSGFEPIPSGRYNCSIFEVKWDKTKGREGAKLPEGTPMLRIQFKVLDEPYENRRLFTQFVIPPDNYDATKRNRMLGMLVRFLVAAGYEEKAVKSKKFTIEPDDIQGRELVVTVGQDKDLVDPEQMTNVVKGYKPAGASTGSTESSGLI